MLGTVGTHNKIFSLQRTEEVAKSRRNWEILLPCENGTTVGYSDPHKKESSQVTAQKPTLPGMPIAPGEPAGVREAASVFRV